MGVTTAMLGQQVRCPHCKQIVVAPPHAASPPEAAANPAGGTAGEISFRMPRRGEEDSIFASPESTDALFPEESRLPPMEASSQPTEPDSTPAWPNLQMEGQTLPPPQMEPPPQEIPTVAYTKAEDLAAPEPGREAPLEPVATVETDNAWSAGGGGYQENTLEMPETPGPARRAATRGGGNLFLAGLLIFLVPYAVVATAAAIYMYFQMKSIPNPLEVLPDGGDNPGATRKGPNTRVYQRQSPDAPLPPHLRVPLGGAIQIGALEIKPLKVERKQVIFKYEKSDREPRPSQEDALILTLRLRNTSEDVHFVPTDPAFVKMWTEGHDVPAHRPYTMLEVGGKKFYGGPCPWNPRGRQTSGWRDRDPQESIEGQDYKVLKPGETIDTVMATNPENLEVLKAVDKANGPMLWRVHLRRGLVKVKDGEASATAVIGVDIQPKDIPKS